MASSQIVCVLYGLAAVLGGAGVTAQNIGIAVLGLVREIAQALDVVLDGRLFLFANQQNKIPPFTEIQCVKGGRFSCAAVLPQRVTSLNFQSFCLYEIVQMVYNTGMPLRKGREETHVPFGSRKTGCALLRVLLCLLIVWLVSCTGALAECEMRALLIGVDEFVSRPSAAPSSANNVQTMKTLFSSARDPLQSIIVPPGPVTDADAFAALVQGTFADADEGDLSCLYLSTHGVYEEGQEPMLLLSDGVTENGLTPAQLEEAFDGIAGTKLIILDACNSGAFIGKGMSRPPEKVHFLGDDFKVLTSSGALEESWYWSSADGGAQGGFYFTHALTQGLSAASDYPADANRDGDVTLTELYSYLFSNHAASTPQVYPQVDDTVIYRYDPAAPRPSGLARSPIMDVTFSGTTLDLDTRQIGIEFIATRPVRVAYQIVYQRDGKWEFDNAQLIYDGAERFTAFGDEPGAISAGRKVRSINLGQMSQNQYGYVLVQLVSIDEDVLTVHAGRVICVPPTAGDMNLTARVQPAFDHSGGNELSIFIGHDYPCTLSVAIINEDGEVVHRLCHRQSTRPLQIEPAGSVFYWNGLLKNGDPAQPGQYRVRAQAHMNDTTVTVLSATFSIE